MSASALTLVLVAMTSACRGGSEEPPPETHEDVEGAPGESTQGPIAAADPGRAFFDALPPGVVSSELVGACREVAQTSGIVERARRCAEAPSAPECEERVPLGVVGIDDEGRMAIVSAPWLEPCGAPPHYRVFEARPPSLRTDDVTTYEPSRDAVRKTLAWVAARARRLAPVDNLVALACELEAWTTTHERLAVLRAPLEGWMVTIARGRRALPVRLVAPGNKRVHELGFVDVGPGVCDTEEEGRDAPCEREVSASVVQLVVSPTRRTVVLTARVAPHERCAPERVIHVSFRVPDVVRSLMSRPAEHGIQRRGTPPRRRSE